MTEAQQLIEGFDGQSGLQSIESQFPATITKWNRRACEIPCIQGSGQSYDSLIDGGMVDNENPSFTIRRAAIAAERPGGMFKQGDKIVVGGKTLKVKAASFDPADPSVRITTEGEEQ